MIDAINSTKYDGRDCEGCGEPADRETRLQGRQHPVALCGDCFHDRTSLCACGDRIWQVDGYRLYATPELYCPSCSSLHPHLVLGREQASKADVARDESFEQGRR